MSSYLRNQPVATDDLSVSQPILLGNTNKADDSFGVDHYPFSNLTVNNGKHNQVTTPAYVATPPTGLPPVTAANEPKIYAFQDSANVGVVNYSRGPSNAVPTPLTHLQSSSAAIVIANGATSNILDFTGLSRAIGVLYAFDTVALQKLMYSVFWTGTALILTQMVGTITFTAQASGNILQIKNNSGGPLNDVYWTLQLDRLS